MKNNLKNFNFLDNNIWVKSIHVTHEKNKELPSAKLKVRALSLALQP